MSTTRPGEDFERAARRRKFELILAAQSGDTGRVAELADLRQQRAEREAELPDLLGKMVADGDVEEFRSDLDAWARLPGHAGFGGLQGMMFVHQIVKRSDPVAVAALLRDTITVPVDERDAAARINRFAAHVQAIKKGAHPAPKRTPFLLSFFWAAQDHEHWLAAWPSTVNGFVSLGWLVETADLAVDYLACRRIALDLGQPLVEVEHALSWFEKHPFVGLDPSLPARCSMNDEINGRRVEGAYASQDDRDAAERNARVVVHDLKLLGVQLRDRIQDALGRTISVASPALSVRQDGAFRSQGWVEWRLPGGNPGMGIRVWVIPETVTVGLHPGWYRDGWYAESQEEVGSRLPAGIVNHRLRTGTSRRLEPSDPEGGEWMAARNYTFDHALGRIAFASDVEQTATELRPVLNALARLAGERSVATEAGPDDELQPLIGEFLRRTGYPTEADRGHVAEREEMAQALAPDEIRVMDIAALRRMYNGSAYGRPGPMSVLNTTIRDADPARLEELLASLEFLLWGEGPDEQRIDKLLDQDDLGVRGLGESVIMKLLAIAHPDRYVPVFPLAGENGKAKALRLLGLPFPDPSLSRGGQQVAANDALRRRLEPFFPGDPWGMNRFVYWLIAGGGTTDPPDVLDALADELLVDKPFLAELVELLEDKGQIVLYGPPGTGKTFVARRLAAALVSDPTRRQLVQFHPSMSYEDFVEGYRPRESGDGSLGYELRAGPLVSLAERARDAPGVRHILVIDEINRANLPKVLGELLFLLEYRDEQVRMTYRPDEPFELPANLWIIGTMNTADRSIALIDAALRRRFHFVPFFPDRAPVEGLLRRWFDQKEIQTGWIADLVDMVNQELIDELGGPHLQIGPSHFMREGIDEVELRRIWAYNVHPFIEDQLFGEPAKIAEYQYERVRKRFDREAEAGVVEVPTTGDDDSAHDAEELAVEGE